jgi:hypothetical protein
MSQLYAVAESRLYIGAAMDLPEVDVVEADFASVSWTEIKGWTQAGALGDTAALISSSEINRGRDIKMKGTRNAGQMQNVFNIKGADAGQAAVIAAEKSRYNYPFKIVYAGEAPAPKSTTVTITVATPGVVSWTAHGLAVDTAVVFTTTGALPTGLTAGTTYYVKTVLTADTFTVAATVGGAAIATSSTQSGTHTATTVPTGPEEKFIGLVMTAAAANGEANTARTRTVTIEVNSNIVTKAALG